MATTTTTTKVIKTFVSKPKIYPVNELMGRCCFFFLDYEYYVVFVISDVKFTGEYDYFNMRVVRGRRISRLDQRHWHASYD